MPAWITIKNWERHQHYKERTPPWIKLHRSLLDDMEYRLIDPQYRALLVDLWLLAAENEGKVKAHVPDIAFRLRADVVWLDGGLHVLADSGFIELPKPPASVALATCLPRVEESREEIDPKEKEQHTAGVSVIRRNGEPMRYHEVRTRIAAVMAEVAEGARKSLKSEESAEMQADVVFAYWAGILGHEGAMLDAKRVQRLKNRLKENGGNVHELLFVVDGAKRSPYLMGQNERNEKYDGIETLFRDRAQVEKLSVTGGYKLGKEHPLAQKYAALVELP